MQQLRPTTHNRIVLLKESRTKGTRAGPPDRHSHAVDMAMQRYPYFCVDFELAEIYGYTTRAFNQQVKNNASKFDDDFRFQLTREELDDLVRSKNLISRTSSVFQGQSGGTRYLPWAFTESGIYSGLFMKSSWSVHSVHSHGPGWLYPSK